MHLDPATLQIFQAYVAQFERNVATSYIQSGKMWIDGDSHNRAFAAGKPVVEPRENTDIAGGSIHHFSGAIHVAGGTIADLALALGAPVLVVTAAGLGTLNHTALTLEALTARGITLAGLVLGSWPENPGITQRNNLTDLEVLSPGRRLDGVLTAGAGQLSPAAFLSLARGGLAPSLGGCFDPAVFRETNAWQKERDQ